MSSSFHHQGVRKFAVDLPPIAKISIQCPQRIQSSCASAVTQGAQARAPLRNTVCINSPNIIDYPADQFGDKIITSISLRPSKRRSAGRSGGRARGAWVAPHRQAHRDRPGRRAVRRHPPDDRGPAGVEAARREAGG